ASPCQHPARLERMATKPASVKSPAAKGGDRKLDMAQVLAWLETDGLLVADDKLEAMKGLAARGAYQDKHPLQILAERNWTDARNPKQVLSADALTQWLADKVGLPYYRIDPLKIEVRKITAVASYAYAARWGILPVEVGADSITIATAEPWVRGWEKELAAVAKKSFKLVFANPDDIQRYLVEFYSVSKSVFGAEQDSAATSARAQTLEQL